MKKLNNKGFTLVEVLAVVVILGVLASIVAPSALSGLNSGKNSAYKIMISNIKTAAIALYEEAEFNGLNGVNIIDGRIEGITLQFLSKKGFLNIVDDENTTNRKIINPKTKDDISNCKIDIAKTVDRNDYRVTYSITRSDDSNDICPTNNDYAEE